MTDVVTPSGPRERDGLAARPPGRRMSRTALLSIACLVLLALAGEIAASFTQAGNGAYFVEDKDLFIVRKPDLHGYTLGDGRWNECHINRQGLRGEDLPEPRPEGERWILCIGDSFTFGGGLDDAGAWPAQLQRLLGAPETSGVRVLNGGANGWDTRWQRRYLEVRALDAFHPDIVVLGWNWNDLNVDPTQSAGPAYARHFLEAGGTWLSPFSHVPILRESHLYRWAAVHTLGSDALPTDRDLRHSFQEYRRAMNLVAVEPERRIAEMRSRRFGDRAPDLAFWQATDTAPWKMVRSEITAIRDACAGKGARLVVAMLPEPTWDGPGTFPGTERLAAMLDGLDVPWVDEQPDFLARGPDGEPAGRRPELWQRYDMVHPRAEGQALLARGVMHVLRSQSLLAGAER